MQGVYTVYAYTVYTRCMQARIHRRMHVYTQACIYGMCTYRVCSPYTLYTAYTVYIGKYPYIQGLYRACIYGYLPMYGLCRLPRVIHRCKL